MERTFHFHSKLEGESALTTYSTYSNNAKFPVKASMYHTGVRSRNFKNIISDLKSFFINSNVGFKVVNEDTRDIVVDSGVYQFTNESGTYCIGLYPHIIQFSLDNQVDDKYLTFVLMKTGIPEFCNTSEFSSSGSFADGTKEICFGRNYSGDSSSTRLRAGITSMVFYTDEILTIEKIQEKNYFLGILPRDSQSTPMYVPHLFPFAYRNLNGAYNLSYHYRTSFFDLVMFTSSFSSVNINFDMVVTDNGIIPVTNINTESDQLNDSNCTISKSGINDIPLYYAKNSEGKYILGCTENSLVFAKSDFKYADSYNSGESRKTFFTYSNTNGEEFSVTNGKSSLIRSNYIEGYISDPNSFRAIPFFNLEIDSDNFLFLTPAIINNYEKGKITVDNELNSFYHCALKKDMDENKIRVGDMVYSPIFYEVCGDKKACVLREEGHF